MQSRIKAQDAERRRFDAQTKRALQKQRISKSDLIYVIGLNRDSSDESELKGSQFFGQYGSVRKIVINKENAPSNGSRSKTSTAYITYSNWHEASMAILSLNGAEFEGRTLKVSFGMTKYCQYFVSN